MAAEKQRRESPDLTPEEEMAIERTESGMTKIKTYKNIDEFRESHAGWLSSTCAINTYNVQSDL
jgi:hypothetical protein